MMWLMNPYRAEALELRSAGYSYGVIKEKLGVSKSTLSNWLSHVPFVPNKEVAQRVGSARLKSALYKQNIKLADIETMRRQGALEVGVLSSRDLFMLGVGLYLGEGSKAIEEIRIVNSDPNILRIAVKWLRESVGISLKHLQVTVHGYPDTDPGEAIGFWSEQLKIPQSQFGKMIIDMRSDKSLLKRGKLPHGTAHLSVRKRDGDFCLRSVHRRIIGWIDATVKQI